jgi:hypothetical protein
MLLVLMPSAMRTFPVVAAAMMAVVVIMAMVTIPAVIIDFVIEPDAVIPARTDPNDLFIFIVVIADIDFDPDLCL